MWTALQESAAAARLAAVWRNIIPHLYGDSTETRAERVIRRVRIGVVIAACLVTLQSTLMVLGAWRNDRQIERHMGTAEANVLSAGPRRSTIEFVTPDRVTYRPELGVLFPSELEAGMRIYVEYDVNNPDLVRVQGRDASLAIIPRRFITYLRTARAGGGGCPGRPVLPAEAATRGAGRGQLSDCTRAAMTAVHSAR